MSRLKYYDFIKLKGRNVSEINPGSEEVALPATEALQAISLLEEENILPVLGGEILSTKENVLIYAQQYWGSGYHYLDWYCERKENESQLDYCKRSYRVALNAIREAEKVANKLKHKCYIVLVT